MFSTKKKYFSFNNIGVQVWFISTFIDIIFICFVGGYSICVLMHSLIMSITYGIYILSWLLVVTSLLAIYCKSFNGVSKLAQKPYPSFTYGIVKQLYVKLFSTSLQ